jgi:hypothetical protein
LPHHLHLRTRQSTIWFPDNFLARCWGWRVVELACCGHASVIRRFRQLCRLT